jgi:hypothetical protein
MESRTVRLAVNVDDVVDAQSFVQRPLFLMVTAVGYGAVLVGLVMLVVGGSPGLATGVIGYGLLDLALVQFRPLRRFIAARRARRLIGTELEFELDPQVGLRWTERGGGGSIGWSSLSNVREDGRLLAFMAGGIVRATIPKRAFPSSAAMVSFRDEARRLIDSEPEQ